MVKLGWRMMREKQTLWARILWAKYGSPFANTHSKHNTSYVWKSMKYATGLLTEGFCRQFAQPGHNGSGNAKAFAIQDVYDMQRNTTSQRTENNKIKWRRIWKIKGPQSSNWFLWQIRHNRLPTKEIMYKRRMSDSPTCDVCHRVPETLLHALRDCGRVNRMWRSLIPPEDWHIFTGSKDPTSWIDANLNPPRKSPSSRRTWTFIFREGTRAAWFWRNQTLHQAEFSLSAYAMARQIQRKVRELERMT